MTKEQLDDIIPTYDLKWRATRIINESSESLVIPTTMRLNSRVINDHSFTNPRIIFSMNTEYVPLALVFSQKRNVNYPFFQMTFKNHGADFTPRQLDYHKTAIQVRIMEKNNHLYLAQGMTLLHIERGNDEESIRIVYTLVLYKDLFDELKTHFDLGKDFNEKEWVKIFNAHPGKLQLWIDEQLYTPSNVVNLKNERMKIKKLILPDLIQQGIPIRYMSQTEMRKYLTPFASEIGNFPSYEEMKQDARSLLETSLETFSRVYNAGA